MSSVGCVFGASRVCCPAFLATLLVLMLVLLGLCLVANCGRMVTGTAGARGLVVPLGVVLGAVLALLAYHGSPSAVDLQDWASSMGVVGLSMLGLAMCVVGILVEALLLLVWALMLVSCMLGEMVMAGIFAWASSC